MAKSINDIFAMNAVIEFRGHLQTMWTVFWGFLTPPPPLWTNMDILGTPLPVHVDFSYIGILKSKHTARYLWNI